MRRRENVATKTTPSIPPTTPPIRATDVEVEVESMEVESGVEMAMESEVELGMEVEVKSRGVYRILHYSYALQLHESDCDVWSTVRIIM